MLKGTYHATVEREERILKILTEIGIGKPLGEIYQENNDTFQILTENGIIMIVAGDDRNRVVTMYCTNIPQAKKILNTNKLPTWLVKQIKKNEKIIK